MAKKRQENSFSTFSTSALRGFILCLSARFFSQLRVAPCQSLSAFETGYPAAAKHTHTYSTAAWAQLNPNKPSSLVAPYLLRSYRKRTVWPQLKLCPAARGQLQLQPELQLQLQSAHMQSFWHTHTELCRGSARKQATLFPQQKLLPHSMGEGDEGE